MIRSDATTFDLAQTRLRLKDGLSFSVQHCKNQCWYLIEDESRSQFFRVGAAEYTFVSQLDGDTSLCTAMAGTCSLLGANSLDEQDAINLAKWLVDSGLAHTDASTSADRIQQKAADAKKPQIQQLNPISIRLPLVELDRMAGMLSRYTNWVISWPMAFVWLATCCYGVISLAMSWDRIGQAAVFSCDNLVWMILPWLILQLIHELAHVLTCKKFGGSSTILSKLA